MSNDSCYGCERRQPGCHNVETCETWRKHVEKTERRMAAAQKQRELNEYKFHSMGRLKKLRDM